MQNANRMIKKSGLYMIGSFSSKFVNFILIPLYAFTLTTEGLGRFDYYQTMVNFIEPFAFLAIWEAILRFLLAEEEEKELVIGSTLKFILLAASLVFTIGIVGMFIVENRTLWLCGVLMLISFTISHSWQYYARGLRQNSTYVTASIISAIVNFCMNLILLCLFKMDSYAVFIAFIIGNISAVVWMERKIHIFTYIKKEFFSCDLLKKMLLYSIPLVLNLASSWLISGFGRWVINANLGAQATGLYAFANKFGIVIISLGQVISMALIEESIISRKEGQLGEFYSKTINTVFKIFLGLIIIASPAISMFYSIISDTEYYSSLSSYPWFLIYSLCTVMSVNVGAIFQAVNKTKYQFITTLLGALAVVVISLISVKIWGIVGVAAAQLCGGVIMLVTRYLFARKFVGFHLHIWTILLMSGWYCVTSALCVIYGLSVSIFVFLINFILILLINRKYIIVIAKKIFRRV